MVTTQLQPAHVEECHGQTMSWIVARPDYENAFLELVYFILLGLGLGLASNPLALALAL